MFACAASERKADGLERCNKASWCAVVGWCLRPMKYSESVHVANKTAWTCSWVALGHNKDLWVQGGVGGEGGELDHAKSERGRIEGLKDLWQIRITVQKQITI